MNYEVVAVSIPGNNQEAETFERWPDQQAPASAPPPRPSRADAASLGDAAKPTFMCAPSGSPQRMRNFIRQQPH